MSFDTSPSFTVSALESDRLSSLPRVLVVDDSVTLAGTMAMFFELEGCEARAVYSGAQALVAVEQMQPALVFLDLTMPEMDGCETAQRIRAQRQGEGIKLVALSGWDDEEHRQLAQASGFDHYLTKPVEPEDLRALLARLTA